MGKKQHITFQSGNHAFIFKLFSNAWVELHDSSDKCTWPHVQTFKFQTHQIHMNPYDYPIERVAWKNGNIFFARDKAKYCNFWAISFTIPMANCVLRLKTHAKRATSKGHSWWKCCRSARGKHGNDGSRLISVAILWRTPWPNSLAAGISNRDAEARDLHDWPNELLQESQ